LAKIGLDSCSSQNSNSECLNFIPRQELSLEPCEVVHYVPVTIVTPLMQSFKPGDEVLGKSKLLLRKRGRVMEVITESHQKKYRVAWSDSTSGVIFGRSLQKCLPLETPGALIGLHREDEYCREEHEDSDNGNDSDGNETIALRPLPDTPPPPPPSQV
jgi:hypothetical protein